MKGMKRGNLIICATFLDSFKGRFGSFIELEVIVRISLGNGKVGAVFYYYRHLRCFRSSRNI